MGFVAHASGARVVPRQAFVPEHLRRGHHQDWQLGTPMGERAGEPPSVHHRHPHIEDNERWLNYLHDEMAATVGVLPIGARFPPRPRPLILSGVKMNNINVSNSVVGTINTGTIGVIDQSISALAHTGATDLAQAVKELSEAILRSGDLTSNQKNEVVEGLSVVAEEAAAPQERRRNAVARAIIQNAEKITSLANDITDVCQKWWPVLMAAFDAATS